MRLLRRNELLGKFKGLHDFSERTGFIFLKKTDAEGSVVGVKVKELLYLLKENSR